MGDQFDSNGGGQNIAQGDHAIGSQTNNHGPVISTTGDKSPAVNAQGDVTITYGVPFEKYEQVRDECERLKVEYGIKDAAFASFFRILNQENIPCQEWGAKLREIAFRYKELLLRFEAVTSDDPQVQTLKEQARQAIENSEYDRAEELLDQIDERHDNALHQLHKLQEETAARLEKEQLGKAENLVSKAKLQRLQYRYEKSAQYYQEAAAALPEGRKLERAAYLNAAGCDLNDIASFAEALCLYEQSLFIFREISDREGESRLLNNISHTYKIQGDYGKALEYIEQSLPICREVGDKEGAGAMLNNIGMIYHAKRDYSNALKYLEQSLPQRRVMHDKKGEGISLLNIGEIHREQGEYAVALQYYEQALAINREINDEATESKCLNNISLVCQSIGNLDAALYHSKQSLAIARQIGDQRTESTVLNNIGQVYEIKEDSTTALQYYAQALTIAQKIGVKAEEAVISSNIWGLYIKQGELAKSEPYLSRIVELLEQLEHPDLQNWRETLEKLRTTLRERQ